VSEWLNQLRTTFRHWRRHFKSKLPYVRRREYNKISRSHDELASVLTAGLDLAHTASLTFLKPLQGVGEKELCLFVTHMATPVVKPHVREHIQHLLAVGIEVALIVNTDLPHSTIDIDDGLMQRLAGCCIRDNRGYDFAAWAHAFTLLRPEDKPARLYLVNDSIAGPLDVTSFERMVDTIRRSDHDVIGLTECLAPRRHLQSFFLVFSRRVIESRAFRAMLRNIVNLPSKELVIEVYETRLTKHLADMGFSWSPVIPSVSKAPYATNDTVYRWAELLDRGFPYVKVSVLSERVDDAKLARLIPERFQL
jgi:hypothetical protein